MSLMEVLVGLSNIYPIMGTSHCSDDFVNIDLSVDNSALESHPDYNVIAEYVNTVIAAGNKKMAIGGYMEKRNLYSNSDHFNDQEPRNIHLAIDIWGPIGTSIFAPIKGVVVSGAYNSNHLDYGYTLILRHKFKGFVFHTLYGHLSEQYYEDWKPGRIYEAGDTIADFGSRKENGGWPPHLHFQIIKDLGSWYGDYPGVCRASEQVEYMTNCPDPMLLIKKGIQ